MRRLELNSLIIATTVSLISAVAMPPVLAASSQLKPVLKAIDPSQAKLDTSRQQPAKPNPNPNPNPNSKVNGRPISQPPGKRGQQSGGAQPPPDYQGQGGYPQQGGGYPPQGGGYPPQGGGYAPQGGGYAPQGGGYAPQGGGYAPQGGGYPPQGGGYPPQGGGYAPQGGGYAPQGGGYPPQGGGYAPQGGGYPPAGAAPSFPNENMLPDFGQSLPQSPAPSNQRGGGQPNYGQGYSTYRAPDSRAAPTPLTGSQPSYMPPQQGGPGGPSIESRIMRLEQTAFGSTYPEHELDDRVDHLESEVFGSSGSGDLPGRLAKLEAKLGGQGAFGRTAQAPVSSPVVASGYGSDSGQSPSNYQPRQASPPPSQPSYNSYPPQSYGNPPPSYGNPSSSYDDQNPTRQPSQPRPRKAGAGDGKPGQRQVAIAKPQGVVPAYGATTSGAPGTMDYQGVVNSIPFDSKAGDYFAQLRKGPNGALARWTKFPVRVHLPQGSPQSWQYSLDAGVKKWGQYLPITVTSPSEGADIEVVWINHLPPNTLGITRVQVQRGTMQCVIYLLRPTYYLPDVPERALGGVFLHEMGHGLGIFGHSDFKDDLMVPIELGMVGRKRGESAKFKFGNITPRDVNTLRRIYECPALPQDFSSPQPSDWTLKLPEHGN